MSPLWAGPFLVMFRDLKIYSFTFVMASQSLLSRIGGSFEIFVRFSFLISEWWGST